MTPGTAGGVLPGDGAARRARILVVDDDPMARELVRDALVAAGHEVVEADRAQRARALLGSQHVDLAVVDVLLPSESGLALCAWVRRHHDAVLPLLVLTGLDDDEALDEGLEAGASDVLTKPVEPGLLRQRVAVALAAGRTLRALAASERSLAEAERIAEHGSFELDPVQGRLALSASLREALGLDPKSRVLRWDEALQHVHEEDRALLRRAHEPLAHGTAASVLDLRFRLAAAGDGLRWVEERAHVVRDAPGAPRVRGVLRDVTAQHRQDSRGAFLASHDAVTGLLNRSGLLSRLEPLLSDPAQQSVAVVVVALQQLDDLESRLGAERLDHLLREVARTLRQRRWFAGTSCRPTLVARVAPASFAVVHSGDPCAEQAMVCTRGLVGVLGAPLSVGSHEVRVQVRAGLAIHPEDGSAPGALLRAAETAAHKAEAASGHARRYAPSLASEEAQRLALERDLRGALSDDELQVHFEPQVDARGVVVAVEGLARWPHPSHGWIPPLRFVAAAEDAGLIAELGRRVLALGIAQIAAWRSEGLDLRLAVNVSPHELQEPRFVGSVAQELRRHDLDGSALEIELTEGAILEEGWLVAANLRGLAELGVTLALDDFGTGYSSLSRLAALPFSTLKIDRSFVAGLDRPELRAVVRSSVALARVLGLRSVAEGVETRDQARLLLDEGCDLLQGYLIRPASPASELAPRLRERQPLP